MADLPAAIAELRVALAYYEGLAECNADYDPCAHEITGKLSNLLAAIDAAQPVATVTSSNTGMTFAVVTPGFPDGTKLYAAPPAAVPAGYALVPVEPTEAMLDAGWLAGSTSRVWAAMIAAASKENVND